MIICFCISIIPMISLGKIYHVDKKKGSNYNAGSLKAPFKTIQKAAQVMIAGDTCYIHAGTYYETIRPANSGLENSPLVFSAYGTDEVLINGGRRLKGWTRFKGNIYKIAVADSVKEFFANKQYMLWARHPNMPFDPGKGFDMCRPTLGTANPPEGVDWTGVTVFKSINKEGWWNTVSKSDEYVLLPEGVALGGWLMGVPGLIDSPGEWCWKEGILYFWPVGNKNPNDLITEAKTRDLAFDLSGRSHIVVKKLTVFGATIDMRDAMQCTIDSCRAFYVSSQFDIRRFNINPDDNCAPLSSSLAGKGILVSGSNNIIKNSVIAHSWGNCVSLLGANNKVLNCEIYDANWQGWECAVLSMNGGGHVVRGNTMHDAQRSVILCTNKFGMNPPKDPWFIEYNELYNAGLAKTDNGVIYCFLTDGVGSVISHNWIHDNYNGYDSKLHSGSGIYLDNYSSNFIVHHNVVWNMTEGHTATGIRANNPESQIYNHGFWPNAHQIYNNTMFNCNKAINSPDRDWNGTKGQPYWKGTKLYNNILLSDITFGPATTGNNYTGSNPMFADTAKHDFRLKKGSPCVNTARVIPGITDGYKGSAPDIGAYEVGGDNWIPGVNTKKAIRK
jgi:hypothetical protein